MIKFSCDAGTLKRIHNSRKLRKCTILIDCARSLYPEKSTNISD